MNEIYILCVWKYILFDYFLLLLEFCGCSEPQLRNIFLNVHSTQWGVRAEGLCKTQRSVCPVSTAFAYGWWWPWHISECNKSLNENIGYSRSRELLVWGLQKWCGFVHSFFLLVERGCCRGWESCSNTTLSLFYQRQA